MTAPAAVGRCADRSRTLAPGRDRQPAPDGRRVVRRAVRDEIVRARRHAPLGAVLLTAVVAHVAVAPHLAVRGAAPDVLLVGVVAVAAGRGARAGAAFGFAAGLGADLFLATPPGTSALAFTLVGHVLGRSRHSGPARTAAALCSPTSTCFACRTGRRHDAAPSGEPDARSSRSRRRVAARRAAHRRTAVLTLLGVGAGQLATAAAATSLGGLPFPERGGLVEMAAVAVLSAPLGPPVFAGVRRLRPTGPGGGR